MALLNFGHISSKTFFLVTIKSAALTFSTFLQLGSHALFLLHSLFLLFSYKIYKTVRKEN